MINTDRLRQLAHCAADGKWSEFHMSIPPRPDRDADLVLSTAADEIDRLRAENAELSQALRKIAEDCSWQVNYEAIRKTARAALAKAGAE